MSGSSAIKTFSISDIQTKGVALPNRYAMHSGVGFGKTSIAAFSRAPIFVMTRGETGLTTLIDAGQLPPTPHLPEAETWADLLAAVRLLRTEKHDYKTLVLDTANGAERLMHEWVCERDFDGEWGERGFGSYMRGYEVALADWRMFLNSLDELRKEKGMTIFFLLHTRIKTFKNPSGADYDRYAPEMHEKTWGLTKGWLDCILFGNFEVTVKQGTKVADASKKGKAAELSHRILYTNSDNPTFDAKNRMGLPDEIEMGDSARVGWSNLATAIKESRKTEAVKPEVAKTEVETNG
jgi:hypothetical protein